MSDASGVQRGCLVIGDISGYTAFLAASELDHARGILDGLLNVLVERLAPPFTVAKLEGDAVFCHLPESDRPHGQTVLETIERAYDGFTGAREIMAANTTCTCRACAHIGDLNLKFVAHYGEYARGRIGGGDELTGADVVLVHRLLKNSVIEQTGVDSYALLTEPAIEALGVGAALTPGAAHAERFEHLGEVDGRVHDLRADQPARTLAHQVTVPPEDVWLSLNVDVPVPPARAWDYLTLPDRRAHWLQADRIEETMDGARRGPGTVQHCIHGANVFGHTILEWRPPELFVYEGSFPLGGRQRFAISIAPTPGGSHVSFVAGRLRGPTRLHTAALRVMDTVMIHEKAMLRDCLQRYVEQIERDLAASAPAGGA